jgi:pimeloyl-ACP methyl ester carboxylesterase
VLRLYRGSDEVALAAAGEHLDALGMPALVVWGLQDPWLPPDLGVAYARALPHAELMEVSDAGHWPWLERPDLVERIVAFLHG